MMTLIVFSLISTALYYLGSRALITRWLWSRYSPKLSAFMDCPACTGFWLGLGLNLTVGYRYDLTYLGLNHDLISSALVGLCSIVTTPIVAGLMQLSFEQLGAVQPEP